MIPGRIYEIAQKVSDANLDRELAAQLVAKLPKDVLIEATFQHVLVVASQIHRQHALRIEREAELAGRESEQQKLTQQYERDREAGLALGRYRHGDLDWETGAAFRGCQCPDCLAVIEDPADEEAQRTDELLDLVRRFASALHITWTPELLSTTFALGNNGVRVRWDEATEQEHQGRIDMLTSNARMNLEAAARHQVAIDTLKAAGVKRLKDLRGSAADDAGDA